MKQKSDALNATKKFLADTSSYGVVKRLRCDTGGEFTSSEFKEFLVSNKIKQEFSSPNSPHQNGTAERMWRTLFEMARCLLIEAKLPKFMWNYAVRAAAYIRNRCYNSRLDKTPYEVLMSKKPKLENMHIFGSLCYAYVEKKAKLDPRCEKGIFVGYDSCSPAYLVYYPGTDSLRKVRLVHFTDKFNFDKSQCLKEDGESEDSESDSDNENVICNEKKTTVNDNQSDPVSKPILVEDEHSEINADLTETEREGESRYPSRERTAPKYLEEYVDPDNVDLLGYSVHYCCKVTEIPESYREALNSHVAHKWKAGMDDEIQSLRDNNTYELCSSPNNRCIVGGRWVYAIKEGLNGEEQYKARYVAKGYSQIEGVDYTDTYVYICLMYSNLQIDENKSL